MIKKIKVAVLMGGNSPEHDVSLVSGCEVVKNLDRSKYEVTELVIGRKENPKDNFFKKIKADVVFIAMHGPYGEDGTVQGLLEKAGLKYTGSNPKSSALGMDKVKSRTLIKKSGATVPKSVVINRGKNTKKIWLKLKPPIFVKPNFQGSSVGVTKVKTKTDLKVALESAFEYSNQAIVEEFLEGVEVTSAILGNKNSKALPLVEIVPKKEFFDYEAKYDAKLTDEIVPARINKNLAKKAQAVALKAYKTLGCRGFGRVDMIVKNNKVYILEVNTIPGLTPMSLFPKAAKAADISYPELLDKLIALATDDKP